MYNSCLTLPSNHVLGSSRQDPPVNSRVGKPQRPKETGYQRRGDREKERAAEYLRQQAAEAPCRESGSACYSEHDVALSERFLSKPFKLDQVLGLFWLVQPDHSPFQLLDLRSMALQEQRRREEDLNRESLHLSKGMFWNFLWSMKILIMPMLCSVAVAALIPHGNQSKRSLSGVLLEDSRNIFFLAKNGCSRIKTIYKGILTNNHISSWV